MFRLRPISYAFFSCSCFIKFKTCVCRAVVCGVAAQPHIDSDLFITALTVTFGFCVERRVSAGMNNNSSGFGVVPVVGKCSPSSPQSSTRLRLLTGRGVSFQRRGVPFLFLRLLLEVSWRAWLSGVCDSVICTTKGHLSKGNVYVVPGLALTMLASI